MDAFGASKPTGPPNLSLPATRLPLNTFAISFGLAGLAATWSAAQGALRLPWWIPQIFWALAGFAWLFLIVLHMWRGVRSAESTLAQLRHPVQGPLGGLIPATAMLLTADLGAFELTAARVLLVIVVAVSGTYAAWLIATWFEGRLSLDAFHGGYMLPTVAGGLISAEVAGKLGLMHFGWALFGVGVIFWVALMTVILLRLTIRPALPDALVPTIAITIAPPAVAGSAWLTLTGIKHYDETAAALCGITVAFVLVQLAMVPRYTRLRFSLGFWSFSFPTASATTFAINSLSLETEAPWRFAAVTVLLVAVTLLITAIAVRSVVFVTGSSPGANRPHNDPGAPVEAARSTE